MVMIGDSLTNDVAAPKKLGIQAIWFNPEGLPAPEGIDSIHSLRELL
jgi:FMN phosphatase YigB (HAD superfamily)